MYSTLESEIRKVTRAVVRCYIGEDLKVCVYVVDVYYDICQRLKLEGETENMGVCTKEWKGDSVQIQPRCSWPLPALLYVTVEWEPAFLRQA